MNYKTYLAVTPFAFPHSTKLDDGGIEAEPGMTLRDYFAAKALQGMCACHLSEGWSAEVFAEEAYGLADAMMAAREAPNAPPAPLSHPEAGD